MGRPWITQPSQEGAGAPKPTPLTISVVTSLNPALHWSVCEHGKLTHLRKQRQSTSRSYAAYFNTEKLLTKWSRIIFCMCEKFKQLLSLFNVEQWTPASKKLQVRKGWDFWFLAVITDNLQWINVAKSHKEKKQNKEKYNQIKKLQEAMHTFKYYTFLRKPRYRNCNGFCTLSTSLWDRHYYSCLTNSNVKVTTTINGLAHELPHHLLVTGLGLQSRSSHPCGLLSHVLI